MSPPVPIAAISRLNAFARAPGAFWGGISRPIYDYKTLAALVLALDGTARLRFVRWTGTCNRCTNGRFSHWEWTDGYTVACRDCGGSGQRTLRFTETVIGDGVSWHHPWEGPTSPGIDLARAALGAEWTKSNTYQTADGRELEWHDAGDWRPNLQAAKLERDALVALLNEVEDWVESEASFPVGASSPWIRERATRHLRQHSADAHPGFYGGYKLDLGQAPGGCFVCGDQTDVAAFYGRISSVLHWSLPVCNRHSDGPEKADHPKDPPPAALITPPVRRWLDRHEVAR